MRPLKALLPLVLVALLAGPARSQDKKDTLFGTLSDGDPEARALLVSLCEDSAKMLKKLLAIAAVKDADRGKTVEPWNQAIAEHLDLWNEKVTAAAKKSKAAHVAEAGGVRSETMKDVMKTFPSDWRTWGNTQQKFFTELMRNDFIEWRYDVNERIESLEAGLDKDPKKFKELIDQLKWVSEQVKDSHQKAVAAKAGAEIETELRRFTRIWTLTSNLERTIKARKKYVEEYYKTESEKVETIRKGYEKARDWFQKTDAEALLDPMCKRAATAFALQASRAIEIYGELYEDVRKMNKPILDETLFDDVPGFRGEKYALVAVVERLEKYLHERQDALR